MSKPKKSARSPHQSVAARITQTIIEKLEAGTKPWVKPWRGTPVARPLRACGIPYRGMNIFWLWLVAEQKGYASPYWMTYRQCAELGGQVRKGEKSTIAIFYKSYTKTGEGSDGEERAQSRRVLKSFAVFNADQCDGLPPLYHPSHSLVRVMPSGQREDLDGFFGSVGAHIRHHGAAAYYEPLADRITMPAPDLFEDYTHYYATLAHELSHWTGHKTRLDRNLKNRFGSRAYAAEELVAELSSAILGAELGLPVDHLDNHASYIAHWIALLQSDERAMLTAAARAEDAASYLLSRGGTLMGEDLADSDSISEAA